MTSGPSHYAEAERLAAMVGATSLDLLAALVHAVQANTAATLATSNRRVTDADDWAGVTGT